VFLTLTFFLYYYIYITLYQTKLLAPALKIIPFFCFINDNYKGQTTNSSSNSSMTLASLNTVFLQYFFNSHSLPVAFIFCSITHSQLTYSFPLHRFFNIPQKMHEKTGDFIIFFIHIHLPRIKHRNTKKNEQPRTPPLLKNIATYK